MIARGKCKFPYGFFSIHENKLENASHRRHSSRAEVEESEAHERLVTEVVEARRGRIAYGLRDFVLALAFNVPKPEDTRVVLVHLREHVVDFLDLIPGNLDFPHNLGELEAVRERVVYRFRTRVRFRHIRRRILRRRAVS